MKKKIILILTILTISLPTFADYTFQTVSPAYPVQQYYPQYNNPYYNQTYEQDYQNVYQNPYQTQCQMPYYNPYAYQRRIYPYNLVNPNAANAANVTSGNQVVKRLGQSVLYSMLRGY